MASPDFFVFHSDTRFTMESFHRPRCGAMWNSGSVAQGTTGQDIFHLKYGDVQSKQDENQSVITYMLYMLYMCILYLHLGLIIITVLF